MTRFWTALGAGTLAAFAVFAMGCELIAGLGEPPTAEANLPDAMSDSDADAGLQNGVDALSPEDVSEARPPDGPDDDSTPSNDANTVDHAAEWGPQSLAGLALWLDGETGLSYLADAGANAAHLSWLDQSGWENNAHSVGAATVEPSTIGGRPAVHFDGTTSYLFVPDSQMLQFSTGDFMIALVARHTTSLLPPGVQGGAGDWGYGMLFSKQTVDAPPYQGIALVANSLDGTSGLLWMQLALAQGSAFSTTEMDLNHDQPFYVIARRFSSQNMIMIVNGVVAGVDMGSGYTLDVSAPGYPLYIGGSNKQQDIVGDIAEVIAVKGPTSPADVSNLQSYFKTKYGL